MNEQELKKLLVLVRDKELPINEAIDHSGHFLIVLTPESTSREWVKAEWTSALEQWGDRLPDPQQ